LGGRVEGEKKREKKEVMKRIAMFDTVILRPLAMGTS
jgi:hypothetical protein